MGTLRDMLADEILELRQQLKYIEDNYKEVYDESESYIMNLEVEE